MGNFLRKLKLIKRKASLLPQDKERIDELVEKGEDRLKELQKIDQELLAIQKSTRTTFSFFAPVHNYCRVRYSWYYNWHTKPYATKVHAGALLVILLSSALFFSFPLLGRPNLAKAADYVCTWDGTTGNWSSTANWSNCNGEYPGQTAATAYDVSIPSGSVTLDVNDLNLNNTDNTILGSISVTGTLTTSNNNITFGSMTINTGGVVTAGSSTLIVYGDWARTGTFNYNTSTVRMMLSGSITNGSYFYDLEVAHTGQTNTNLGNIQVSHLFTLAGDSTGHFAGDYSAVQFTGNQLADPCIVSNGANFTGKSNAQWYGANGETYKIPAGTFYARLVVNSGTEASALTTFELNGDVTASDTIYVYSDGNNAVGSLDLKGHSLTSTGGNLNIGNSGDTARNGQIVNSGASESLITTNNITIYDGGGHNKIIANDTKTINMNVSGNWTNSDTFTAGTSTVNFIKSSDAQTLNSGGTGTGKFFNNLTHSGAGTLQLNTSALDVNGVFTNSAGTFDAGTNNLAMTVAGNFSLSNGTTFTKGAGVTFDGSTTTTTYTDSNATPQNLGSVTISKTNNFPEFNIVALASSITADSVNISGMNFFNLSSSGYTLTLAGTGSAADVLTVNGSLDPGSNSTVKYTALNSGGNVNIATLAYNNLQFAPASAESYNLTGSLTSSNAMSGSLTVDTNATLNTYVGTTSYNISCVNTTVNTGGVLYAGTNGSVGTSTFTVSGNWTNNGTFTAGTSTVNFTKTSGTQTLNSGGTGASQIFNNLTHSGAGTLQLVTNALAVSGNITNSNGVFDANNQDVNVSGNWSISGGSFNSKVGGGATTQTVSIVNDGASVISGSSTFNKLAINSSGSTSGKTVSFTSGSTQTISNSLTLAGASGKVLTLNRNGGSGSDQYTIAIPASFTSDQYIQVANSNITGGIITPGNYSNVIDSGNNNGWNFVYTAPIVISVSNPVSPNGSNNWFKTTAPTITLSAESIGPVVTGIYYRWGSSGDYLTYSTPVTAPEGTNSLYAYATDEANNSGLDDPSITEYKVDTAAPSAVDISVSPSEVNGINGYYKGTAPSVTFSETDALSGAGSIYYRWGSSGDFSTYSTALTAPERVNTVYYYGVDIAGNVSSTFNREIKLDTVNPSSSSSINPASPDTNGYYTSAPTVTLSATDVDSSGVSGIKYRWGNGDWADYSSAITAPEGNNILTYYAVDNAGNSNSLSPGSREVKVDTITPDLSSITPAASANPTNNLTVSFNWNAASDGNGSGIKEYLVYIGSISGGTDIVNGTTVTTNSISKTFASVGTYYIRIKAVDNVGHISSFSLEGSVLIDQTSPVITLDNLTSGQYVNSKSIALSGTASKPIVGLNKVEIQIDNGDWNTTTLSSQSEDLSSNSWNYEWKDYTEGNHTIVARALDNAGNEKATSTFSVIVDSIAPTIPSDLRVFNVSNTAASVYAIYLDFAGSNDDTSLIKNYEVFKGDAKIGDINPKKENTNTNYTGNESQPYYLLDADVTSGDYVYKVKAVDNAGNSSETGVVKVNTTGKAIETDVISDPKGTASSVVAKDKTTVTVSWKTVYPATSLVEYGASTSYGNKTELDESLNQGHNVLLKDLKPATTYHAKVTSKDIYGKELVSEDISFTTKPAPEDKSILKIIIDTLQGLFRVLTTTNTKAADTTSSDTNSLESLQGFSNNLLVTDVSFKEKGFYQNVLTFPKGSKVEKSNDDSSYSSINTDSNGYFIDKGLSLNTTFRYRINDGLPVVRKPIVGDDSTLEVTNSKVIEESVLVAKDKVQLTVSWDTNRGASSQVEFGTSGNYGQKTREEESLNMGHSVTLEDLAPDTAYHFRTTSKDANGNTAVSGDFTFTTPTAQKDKGPLEVILESLQRIFGFVKL
ncbi:MAG: fibronectin type III domain-containing protein [Patescibacteria group bacterium]